MKISVITVCYNSENTIEKTIKSVISQKYTDYEYIVIDGGSTDNTINLINKYREHINFYTSEKDDGIYDAVNKGIHKSTGEIISILHSNDIFFSNDTTLKVVNYFNINSSLECLIGNTIINKKGSDKILRKYGAKSFKKWMLRIGFSPPHLSTFIKKNVYDNYGLYKKEYKIAGDFEFFLRIFLKNKIIYKIVNENYIIMESGGKSSYSIKSNFISSQEIIKSFKQNNLYTNWLLILLRFPYKLFQYIIK